jgi:hypothetical protein
MARAADLSFWLLKFANLNFAFPGGFNDLLLPSLSAFMIQGPPQRSSEHYTGNPQNRNFGSKKAGCFLRQTLEHQLGILDEKVHNQTVDWFMASATNATNEYGTGQRISICRKV